MSSFLLINQAFYPDPVATAQHVTDLALFLRSQGHQVTVVTGKRGYSNRTILYSKKENYQGIDILRVGSTGLGKGNVFTRVIDSLTFEFCLIFQLILLPKHDIVVTFTSPPLLGFLGALYCQIRGGILVQWLMDVNPEAAIIAGYIKAKSVIAKFLYWVFEYSLKKSDHVIVLDRWMKQKAIRHGAQPHTITVIPPWSVLGASEKVANLSKETNPFAKRHKLSGKFVILYSGNHSLVHPLDTLLQAAVKLKDDPNILFMFIGSGIRVRDVSDYVDKYDLKNVLQLPYQPREKLNQSLSAADLHVVVMGERLSGLVHTSKIYGILAAARPFVFIGPENSHVTDLIKECSNGYHVRHGDVEGLIKVIQNLRALQGTELTQMGIENFEYLEENYSPDKCMSLFTKAVSPKPI